MKEIPLLNESNPYGYRLNVNHPWVTRHYERYKVHCGTPILSDKQRLEFESYMLPLLTRQQESQDK